MDTIFLKQFGLQRSGTNIFKALIEINFNNTHVLTKYLGGKHEATDWDTIFRHLSETVSLDYGIDESDAEQLSTLVKNKELGFIFNIKEPIPWVESYHRHYLKKAKAKNPKVVKELDFEWIEKRLIQWENLMTSWSKFHQENRENSVMVTHYGILTDARNLLESVQEKFSLQPRKGGELTDKIENYARRGTYFQHGEDLLIQSKKFDSSYHLENQWLESFSEETLEFTKEKVSQIESRLPEVRSYGLKMADLI